MRTIAVGGEAPGEVTGPRALDNQDAVERENTKGPADVLGGAFRNSFLRVMNVYRVQNPTGPPMQGA